MTFLIDDEIDVVVNNAIESYGVKGLKDKLFYPVFVQMIENHVFAKKLGLVVTAIGFETIKPVVIEAYVKGIIENLKDPKEKFQIEEIFDYWKTNRKDILELHNIVEKN